MKNIFAVLLCVGLCISIAVLLPQTGTSNPTVDETGCLVSGCHDAGYPDGSLHVSHPIACDSCHESASGGGPVDSSSCLACHPDVDSELCDLALAHPEAGCLAMGCHADCEVTEGCVVTIACEETTLCTDDDCVTCTATTECDGMEADGVYTWSLNGAGTTGNTGDSIEICPDDLDMGSNTLMVVDTANDNAEDTETLTLEECGPTECAIDVIPESLPKSHWTPLPAVFRIETIGIEDLNLLTTVTIDCDSDETSPFFPAISKTGKVVLPNFGTNTRVILQTGIIWPAVLTQSLDLESETCTVTVDGCADTDTFELEYLSFLGIPLGN